jgi:hypothetical protein
VLIALFISEQGSVFGANWLAQKYSPTQRKCCVRGYRLAGARQDHAKGKNIAYRICQEMMGLKK